MEFRRPRQLRCFVCRRAVVRLVWATKRAGLTDRERVAGVQRTSDVFRKHCPTQRQKPSIVENLQHRANVPIDRWKHYGLESHSVHPWARRVVIAWMLSMATSAVLQRKASSILCTHKHHLSSNLEISMRRLGSSSVGVPVIFWIDQLVLHKWIAEAARTCFENWLYSISSEHKSSN